MPRQPDEPLHAAQLVSVRRKHTRLRRVYSSRLATSVCARCKGECAQLYIKMFWALFEASSKHELHGRCWE